MSLNIPTRRTDSIRKTYCRTPERITCCERKWYFQTRQGNRGPYDTREEAELCLERYVETMDFFEDYRLARRTLTSPERGLASWAAGETKN